MRKKLYWHPGAIYHITTRGNRQGDIFRDRKDYNAYLKILRDSLEDFSASLHCYCLMTNHVHLLIETGDVVISEVMKQVNQFYAMYFNKKYDLVGHLFQGRYNWQFIQDDKYIIDVSRYIHLNPVKANIVNKPEDYEWSSYKIFVGEKEGSLVEVHPEKILYYFQNDKEWYKRWCQVPGTTR